jgi:hypothetical protein
MGTKSITLREIIGEGQDLRRTSIEHITHEVQPISIGKIVPLLLPSLFFDGK